MYKIAFLSHLDLNLYLFRLPIMIELVKQGYTVYAICPRGDKFNEFEKYGILPLEYKIERQSLNPFKELKTIRNIYKVIKPLDLDILQNFTSKPNIYGSISGHLAKIPMIINAVTGLGSYFISNTKKSNAVRLIMEKLYKESNKRVSFVIFQNKDDMNYFITKQLVNKDKAILIKSSGIDTRKFKSKLITTEIRQSKPIVVLMIARAIWHKGIREYYAAADILKEKNINFFLIGDTDKGNPSCADESFLNSGNVKWLGYKDNIQLEIEKCDIFVLPSYREGIPRTLLEAMSMSKPIVTTNAIGCREVVDDNVNGFLVPIQDSKILAKKILQLAEDDKLRNIMGIKGREKALNEYDSKIIVNQYISIYNKFNLKNVKKNLCIVVSVSSTINSFMLTHISKLKEYYEVTVVVSDNLISNSEFKIENIKINRKIKIIEDIFSIYQLYNFFRKNRFDLVLSITPKAGLLTMLSSYFLKIKVRMHFFTGQVWVTKKGTFRYLLKLMDKIIVKASTIILIDSQSQKDFLIREKVILKQQGIVLNKGSISGVNLKKFKSDILLRKELRKNYNISSNDIVFIFLGRINKDKGILDIIQVFNKLFKNYSHIKLFIVGSDEDNFKHHLEFLLNNENVFKLDFTNTPEKLLNLSDVLILPSYREGFGTTVIEAAAMKIPTIGSNIYGLNDAIVDGETGVLHEVNNVDDMYEKYSYFIENKHLIKEFGRNAYDRVILDFNDELITKLFVNIINKESLNING